MRFYRVTLALFCCLVSTPVTFAQATAAGSFVGVVSDATGAAIAGATVTATNSATNTERSTKTNSSGEYRIDLLPPGDYNIHAEASGFSPTDVKNLPLQVGTTVTANFPLHTGSVNTTVEVQAATVLLDAEKTDSSTNVTPQQVTDLPINGRDAANLAILAPGVKMVDSYDPTKNRYAVYAVNGSSGRNTNTTVNGIDNKDGTVGGAVMQLPLEAVEEFKISTARFSAENGRSEGAALNIITKSGTNQYHGALYGFFRSQDFQTTNALDEASGNSKPAYSREQYGGSFGGYIRKDKDFGFFAYEGIRERSNISVDANTYAELTLAIPLGAVPVHQIPTPFDEKRYNGRLDHNFNSKHHAYISYTAQDNKSQNDQSTNQMDQTEGNFTLNDLIITNFSLNSVFSSHAINSFTFGFQYWNNLIDSNLRVPYFTFPDGVSFGTNINVPQKSSQHKFQFKDDFAYNMGRHTLKFGVDYLYEPQLGGFFENNPTPEFDFFDSATHLLNPALYPQNGKYAGFSAPGVIQGSTGTSGDPSFNLSAKMIGFYGQDDWRVNSHLLLNLGLRYDKDINTYGIPQQQNSRTYQEMVAAYKTGLVTVPTTRANEYGVGYTPSLAYLGGTYNVLPHNDALDLSPRIGISIDVFGNSKFVLRGGYGLYYGQTFENIPLFMIQQANNTVFANTYTINCNGPGVPCQPGNNVPGTNIPLNQYRYGNDPFPVIPPANFNLAAGSTGREMDSGYRNPLTQQVNAGVQYAITHESVLEAEYVQARGLHEDKTMNINPTQYFAGGARPFSAAYTAAGVPVLGRFGLEAAIGRSYYDAMNVSYRANFHKYVTTIINYTWGSAFAFEGNPAAFRGTATNPFLGQFRRPDYGHAPNDEKHHITAAGTVTLPFKIMISPIIQAGTARPVYNVNGYDTIEASSDLWGIGSGRGNPHAAYFVGQPKTVASYVSFYQAAKASGNVGAFYKACLAAGSCVETNFDQLRGQPYIQFDTRIGKTITFKERYNVDLFFQGFNITNRANYGGNYNGNISSYAAGTTALKPSGFVNPSSTIVPRSFTGEFGGRFYF